MVVGDCDVESYEAFLEELYNEDHGIIDYNTVIMQSKPNDQLTKLVNNHKHRDKITYLMGDSLIHKDLERCKADQSTCVVILANKYSKNPQCEDFSNLMKLFAFRNSSYMGTDYNLRICIQLLCPESKKLYLSSLSNSNEQTMNLNQIICVEEIKLQLLGKSCLCPGITTIISSLITSNKSTLENLTEEQKKIFLRYM